MKFVSAMIIFEGKLKADMIQLIQKELTIDESLSMQKWKWEVEEEETFNPDEFYGGPSKSQRKRDMIALQKIGGELVEQSVERIRSAIIPDDLRDAVLECQRIKNHEGRRRQLQYIGRLMRQLSEDEVASVKDQLERWKGFSKADTALLHAAESLRTQLLENPNAVTDFLKRFPTADSQQIRTLIRNAKKEIADQKIGKAYRGLYRQIRELVAVEQAPQNASITSKDSSSD